jgi:phosphoesterase RecJ-like protein
MRPSKKVAEMIINIDHHSPINNWGDYNLVDVDAASTTEIIYRLFHLELKKEIDNETANLVYLGILGDTQNCTNFRYTQNLDKICKKLLLEWKINKRLLYAFKSNLDHELLGELAKVFEETIEIKSEVAMLHVDSFKLLKRLPTAEFIKTWRVARNKFQQTNQIGIFVTFLTLNDRDLRITISCAHHDIDAAQICFKLGQRFNSTVSGGGHQGCAGVKFRTPKNGISSVKKAVLKEIRRSLKKNKSKAFC